MGRKNIINEPLYREILCFIVDKELVKSKEIAKKFPLKKNKSRSNLSMKLSVLMNRKLIKKSEDIPRAYEPDWQGILDYWLDNYFSSIESELFEYFFKKGKINSKEMLFGFLKFYLKRILARKEIGFQTKKKFWTYMSGPIVDLDSSFKTLKEVYFKLSLSKRPSKIGHYMFCPSDNFKNFLRTIPNS